MDDVPFTANAAPAVNAPAAPPDRGPGAPLPPRAPRSTRTLHIVRKPAGQRAFAVIPRRWAVERTFAWLTAHRRLARDYERDPAVSEAMIRWAAISTITRRLARRQPATRQQRRTFTATS